MGLLSFVREHRNHLGPCCDFFLSFLAPGAYILPPLLPPPLCPNWTFLFLFLRSLHWAFRTLKLLPDSPLPLFSLSTFLPPPPPNFPPPLVFLPGACRVYKEQDSNYPFVTSRFQGCSIPCASLVLDVSLLFRETIGPTFCCLPISPFVLCFPRSQLAGHCSSQFNCLWKSSGLRVQKIKQYPGPRTADPLRLYAFKNPF